MSEIHWMAPTIPVPSDETPSVIVDERPFAVLAPDPPRPRVLHLDLGTPYHLMHERIIDHHRQLPGALRPITAHEAVIANRDPITINAAVINALAYDARARRGNRKERRAHEARNRRRR